MSPDLKLATIYIMPLGGRDTEIVMAALERNKKYLRGEVARRVNLKFAPDLRFRVDDQFDEAERIEKLLRTPAVQRDLAPNFGQRLMIATPAKTVLDTEARDADKNIFSDSRTDDSRRINNDPRQKQQRQNQQPRRDRRDIHGWIVLDKPIGMTSTQAVAVVKRLFSPPSAPVTPARSIHSRPADFQSRSAKRPRPFRS